MSPRSSTKMQYGGGYGGQQGGYGAPQQGYGQPQQGGYGAQQGGYGAPQQEVVRLSGASSRLWVLAATPASRPLALSTPTPSRSISPMIPYSLCFPGDDFVLGRWNMSSQAHMCRVSRLLSTPSRWQRDSVFNWQAATGIRQNGGQWNWLLKVSSTTSSTATR